MQSSVAARSPVRREADAWPFSSPARILTMRPRPQACAPGAFEVLQAPMLRFEPVAFHDDVDAHYGAVIVTSANALRGIESHLKGHRLLELPLFAVGEHTASAARRAGFTHVISANGDATSLARSRARQGQGEGAEESLHAALSGRRRSGARSRRRTRRTRLSASSRRPPTGWCRWRSLPREACDAFAANRIEAVLHYSRRSARAFLEAARAGGVEISALGDPAMLHLRGVASVVRDAGATQVMVAASPDENALFGALDRALRSGSRYKAFSSEAAPDLIRGGHRSRGKRVKTRD